MEGHKTKTGSGVPKASILTSAGLPWKALGQNRPRGVKSIDFDVGVLDLKSSGVKAGPEGLKASILISAGLRWRALGSKPAPEG